MTRRVVVYTIMYVFHSHVFCGLIILLYCILSAIDLVLKILRSQWTTPRWPGALNASGGGGTLRASPEKS